MSRSAGNTRETGTWMQVGGRRHPAADRLRILDTMTPETDRSTDSEVATLLADCARRDREAFQRLYERTAPQLLASLLRILRQRALAEDALQDVFVQVWNRAGQFEPRPRQRVGLAHRDRPLPRHRPAPSRGPHAGRNRRGPRRHRRRR